MKRTDWFDGYAGEKAEELFSYPAKNQYAALVQGFREGIQRKAERKGEKALTSEERVVLSVMALHQEVNNGGYDQFFRNSSRKFARIAVDSLERIGRRREAKTTQSAVDALRLTTLTASRIRAAMAITNDERDRELEQCDQAFYKTQKGVAKSLYAFIEANKDRIAFS